MLTFPVVQSEVNNLLNKAPSLIQQNLRYALHDAGHRYRFIELLLEAE